MHIPDNVFAGFSYVAKSGVNLLLKLAKACTTSGLDSIIPSTMCEQIKKTQFVKKKKNKQ